MSETKRTALWILLAALLVLSLYHFISAAHAAGAHGFADLGIFLRMSEVFLERGTLYYHAEHAAASFEPATSVFKFPPFSAVFLLLLVRDGIQDGDFIVVWILQIAIYLATALFAVRTLRPAAAWPFAALAAVLALNFEPFFETLWRLQLETPILLLLLLGLYGMQRGRDALAGAALGVAVMLKIYPGMLLLYLLLRRRWRAVGWCLGAMVAIQLLSLAVFGLSENFVYLFRILPGMLGEAPLLDAENLGLGRYVQSLLGAGPGAAAWITRLLALALAGASVAAVLRRGEPSDEPRRTALEFGLFVTLVLLLLANSWVNYQLLLLLPLLVLLSAGLEPERKRWTILAVTLAAGVLLLFYAPCGPEEPGIPCSETPWFLGLVHLPRGLHDSLVGLRVLATLGIWLTLLAELSRRPAGERAPAPSPPVAA